VGWRKEFFAKDGVLLFSVFPFMIRLICTGHGWYGWGVDGVENTESDTTRHNYLAANFGARLTRADEDIDYTYLI
jgi:hypothetical protein